MSEWRLHFFGRLSLVRGEQEIVSFGTTRAAKMLVLLGLAHSGSVSRNQLRQQLWPNEYYDATSLRLRQEIHRLKRALGEAGDLMSTSTSEVRLDRSRVRTDIDVLEDACRGVLTEDLTPLLGTRFLPGWDDLWAIAESDAAEALALQAGISGANKLLQMGEAQNALVMCRKLIALHPLDENLRMIAVSAHAKLGSMSSAVAEYAEFKQSVKDRLGSDASQSAAISVQQLTPPPGVDHDSSGWTSSIPSFQDPIFGRDDLISKTCGHLGNSTSARFVTLVGPGGIGKTRLAIEVAHKMSQEGTFRVAFASLLEVVEPAMWSRAVLSSLGMDVPGEADADHYLATILSRRPTVLVLDNLETVLPDAADSIASVMSKAGTTRFLGTSVVPTRVAGEVLITVGPLDPHTDGRDFLLSALELHRGKCVGDPETIVDIQKLAINLDGYPLALRLAGARLRLLEPHQLLEQIELALSRSNDAGAPIRHRSLQTALASSYHNISPNDRLVLQRLSAYPAGIGMDHAKVAFRGEPYLDSFERLLDHALAVLDSEVRYARLRLLSPINIYVRGEMSEDEQAQTDRLAAQSTLEFVKQFQLSCWRPLALEMMEKLELESENVVAAWRWALEHDSKLALDVFGGIARLESARGRGPALLRQMDCLRPHWPTELSKDRAELELHFAQLCFASHKEDLARPSIEVAAGIAEASGDLPLIARVRLCESSYAWRRDFHAAEAKTQEALSLAERKGNRYLCAKARKMLGSIADYRQQSQLAIEHLGAAYRGFEACGADLEAATTGIYYAGQMWYAGQEHEAMPTLRACSEIVRRSRDPLAWAYLYEIEGRMAFSNGDYSGAAQHYREALRIWEAVGSHYQEADQHHSLARCMFEQGLWLEARESIRRAADHWVADSNLGGLCCSIVVLAAIVGRMGNTHHASQLLAFAKDLEREHRLVLVKSELEFRRKVEASFGSTSRGGDLLTLEAAHRLFDVVPEPQL